MLQEKFILLSTSIDNVKHSHVKTQNTINKNIKIKLKIFKCEK